MASKNPLLENAVASLCLGLEDFESGGAHRHLSAVRNLHAGVLLLFKERLRILSPADSKVVLVKRFTAFALRLDGSLKAVGKGKVTVGAREIRERFELFGIEVDWDRVVRVAQIRNAVEHYHPNANPKVIVELMSNCFLIVRDFVNDELGLDPLTLLGHQAWSTLLKHAEVHEKELVECTASVEAIDWESGLLDGGIGKLKCEDCRSSLLMAAEPNREAGLVCRACGNRHSFEESAERVVSKRFRWERYMAMKDGDDPPVAHCPSCLTETYLLDYEDEGCVICGETYGRKCEMCGNDMDPSESSICDHCRYIINKDD